MTEEDAKTKACCGPPAVAIAALLAAGQALGGDHGRCMGSACMAWRWTGEKAPSPQIGSVDFAVVVLGTEEQRAEIKARRDAPRSGFCGLAGSPSPTSMKG